MYPGGLINAYKYPSTLRGAPRPHTALTGNYYSLQFLIPAPVAARSAAACLLQLRVRILPGVWMSASFECCLLSVYLCVRLITLPEDSRCAMCYLGISTIEWPSSEFGCCVTETKNIKVNHWPLVGWPFSEHNSHLWCSRNFSLLLKNWTLLPYLKKPATGP